MLALGRVGAESTDVLPARDTPDPSLVDGDIPPDPLATGWARTGPGPRGEGAAGERRPAEDPDSGLVTLDRASPGRKSEVATLKGLGEAEEGPVPANGGGIDRDGIDGRCGGGGEYGRAEKDSLRECIGERAPFGGRGLGNVSREEYGG